MFNFKAPSLLKKYFKKMRKTVDKQKKRWSFQNIYVNFKGQMKQLIF